MDLRRLLLVRAWSLRHDAFDWIGGSGGRFEKDQIASGTQTASAEGARALSDERCENGSKLTKSACEVLLAHASVGAGVNCASVIKGCSTHTSSGASQPSADGLGAARPAAVAEALTLARFDPRSADVG